jgi:hypothetical protein
VRLGNPSVSLLHVQNHVNDLAEHLVEGGRRIVAPVRAHAGTDAGWRPPHAQGRAIGLGHRTSGTSLPVTSGSSRPASARDIRSVNKRGSPAPSVPRPAPPRRRPRLALPSQSGGRRRRRPPSSPDATAPQHGYAISGHKEWTVTICGNQPRTHAHWNRPIVRLRRCLVSFASARGTGHSARRQPAQRGSWGWSLALADWRWTGPSRRTGWTGRTCSLAEQVSWWSAATARRCTSIRASGSSMAISSHLHSRTDRQIPIPRP